MSALPLAVDIADAVSNASKERRPLDAQDTASQLADADASRDEILDVLREEVAASGVS